MSDIISQEERNTLANENEDLRIGIADDPDFANLYRSIIAQNEAKIAAYDDAQDNSPRDGFVRSVCENQFYPSWN